MLSPNSIVTRISRYEEAVRRICLFTAVVIFGLGLIGFGLHQLWPGLPVPDRFVPNSLLGAITPAFAPVLAYELFVLTLATSGAYVSFVIKLFEVVSLIVLRDLFKRLDELAAGFSLSLLGEVGLVAGGAVMLYFLIEVMQRLEQHFLSGSLRDELPGKVLRRQQRFKDVLELGLLAFFVIVMAYEVIAWALGNPTATFDAGFVNLVFSGVIVYSISLLFLVLSTTGSYEVLFEYSALVLTAILALIAFAAPIHIRIPLLVADLIFIIIVLSLHGFARGKGIRLLLKRIDAK